MSKILKRLEKQKEIEGDTLNLKILNALINNIHFHSEWQTFTLTKSYKYGNLSYESHIFYYVKPHILDLIDIPKLINL